MATVHAFAADVPGGPLKPFQYQLGPLGDEEVDIAVESCGICHSDLSMLKNDWGMTQYPFVPGHEVVGHITAAGPKVTDLKVGQRAGLGWWSMSCMTCPQCLAGDHNLCSRGQATIVGRHGGFADRVRAHHVCVVPVPDELDPLTVGPLFCGGITVFNPLIQFNIRPTDSVAVVGIGGLGHMALKFCRAWGCEVTAFTTSPAKAPEARDMGAHHVLNTRLPADLAKAANRFDVILVTVNVDLDWPAYVQMLKPRGRLHIVGAAPGVSTPVFPLLTGQRSISGSPVGSPLTIATMLNFAARHKVQPIIETFPMKDVNEAIHHLESGQARYRIVLTH
jgi:uncharacterized zinc-type alcohol dehydrogenase-like protein